MSGPPPPHPVPPATPEKQQFPGLRRGLLGPGLAPEPQASHQLSEALFPQQTKRDENPLEDENRPRILPCLPSSPPGPARSLPARIITVTSSGAPCIPHHPLAFPFIPLNPSRIPLQSTLCQRTWVRPHPSSAQNPLGPPLRPESTPTPCNPQAQPGLPHPPLHSHPVSPHKTTEACVQTALISF